MERQDLLETIDFQNRLIRAMHVVAQLTLPPEDRERILDVVTEQIVDVSDIRSLTLALVDWEKEEVEVVRSAIYTNLVDGRRSPLSSLHLDRLSGKIYPLVHGTAVCLAVQEEGLMVVNGENEKIKQSSDYNPNEWKDKIAYFPWLSYRGECIGILAGACPCEDEETALDWHRKITPLLDMVASLLKSMQQVGKLQRNALNFEAPVEVSLSKREIEVLKLVALGCSSKEVSEQIQVSERTIHSYRQRISQKLKRYSTADLTRYAVMLGLVPLSDRSPNPSS